MEAIGNNGRLLYRPREAAAMLGVSAGHIYAEMSKGNLPCVKIGKSVRIPRAELEAFIAAQVNAWREAGGEEGGRAA